MHWTFVARFTTDPVKQPWLFPFVPAGRHQFSIIPRRNTWANPNWHQRTSRMTGYEEWLGIWRQSREAFVETQGGIITAFPQLAATVGIQQRLARKRVPVVAWYFNLGARYPRFRGWLTRSAMKDIDRFIVHSRRELENYSQWLGFSRERFEFVPLQQPEIPVTFKEEMANPFILAMGSAHRNYQMLFDAVKKLSLRTVVVSGQRALEGLTIPPQVEVRSGLTMNECHRLAQEARVNVVPLFDRETAAGQVTIVSAMRMSCPVIATHTIGSEDYIKDGETGLLTLPDSVDDLAGAIDRLWNDQKLRNRLGEAAGRYSAQYFSDEAAGAALGRILDSVADEAGLW
ncbi:MAG: glycosyltransferase family 4 protein [Chroococcidiopsidaceae cyanobacterium CP_BM_ER_R8_30]|nr:glycosyltransferase family 4 protein [Chroococcidiopsidaceae cyanobacterium CP_BM_ER_R8_30]